MNPTFKFEIAPVFSWAHVLDVFGDYVFLSFGNLSFGKFTHGNMASGRCFRHLYRQISDKMYRSDYLCRIKNGIQKVKFGSWARNKLRWNKFFQITCCSVYFIVHRVSFINTRWRALWLWPWSAGGWEQSIEEKNNLNWTHLRSDLLHILWFKKF